MGVSNISKFPRQMGENPLLHLLIHKNEFEIPFYSLLFIIHENSLICFVFRILGNSQIPFFVIATILFSVKYPIIPLF
jgi:hypothetical protein